MQNEVTDLIAKTHGTRPVGRTDREYSGLKSHNHYTFSLSFCILQDVKPGLGGQILVKLHNICMTWTDTFPLWILTLLICELQP